MYTKYLCKIQILKQRISVYLTKLLLLTIALKSILKREIKILL